eukprot:Hpha_TRINITY_DN16234_c0_g3::TRINITY_DN16234_c0_g3_i2::g.13359::m.13359
MASPESNSGSNSESSQTVSGEESAWGYSPGFEVLPAPPPKEEEPRRGTLSSEDAGETQRPRTGEEVKPTDKVDATLTGEEGEVRSEKHPEQKPEEKDATGATDQATSRRRATLFEVDDGTNRQTTGVEGDHHQVKRDSLFDVESGGDDYDDEFPDEEGDGESESGREGAKTTEEVYSPYSPDVYSESAAADKGEDEEAKSAEKADKAGVEAQEQPPESAPVPTAPEKTAAVTAVEAVSEAGQGEAAAPKEGGQVPESAPVPTAPEKTAAVTAVEAVSEAGEGEAAAPKEGEQAGATTTDSKLADQEGDPKSAAETVSESEPIPAKGDPKADAKVGTKEAERETAGAETAVGPAGEEYKPESQSTTAGEEEQGAEAPRAVTEKATAGSKGGGSGESESAPVDKVESPRVEAEKAEAQQTSGEAAAGQAGEVGTESRNLSSEAEQIRPEAEVTAEAGQAEPDPSAGEEGAAKTEPKTATEGLEAAGEVGSGETAAASRHNAAATELPPDEDSEASSRGDYSAESEPVDDKADHPESEPARAAAEEDPTAATARAEAEKAGEEDSEEDDYSDDFVDTMRSGAEKVPTEDDPLDYTASPVDLSAAVPQKSPEAPPAETRRSGEDGALPLTTPARPASRRDSPRTTGAATPMFTTPREFGAETSLPTGSSAPSEDASKPAPAESPDPSPAESPQVGERQVEERRPSPARTQPAEASPAERQHESAEDDSPPQRQRIAGSPPPTPPPTLPGSRGPSDSPREADRRAVAAASPLPPDGDGACFDPSAVSLPASSGSSAGSPPATKPPPSETDPTGDKPFIPREADPSAGATGDPRQDRRDTYAGRQVTEPVVPSIEAVGGTRETAVRLAAAAASPLPPSPDAASISPSAIALPMSAVSAALEPLTTPAAKFEPLASVKSSVLSINPFALEQSQRSKATPKSSRSTPGPDAPAKSQSPTPGTPTNPMKRLRQAATALLTTCKGMSAMLESRVKEAQERAMQAQDQPGVAWAESEGGSPVKSPVKSPPSTTGLCGQRWRSATLAAGFLARLNKENDAVSRRAELLITFHTQREVIETRIYEEEATWSAAVLEGRWQDPIVSASLEGTRELWTRLKMELSDLDGQLAQIEGAPQRKSLQIDTADRLEQVEKQRSEGEELHTRVLAAVEAKLEKGSPIEKDVAATLQKLEVSRWERHSEWLETMKQRAVIGQVVPAKSAKAGDGAVAEAARVLAVPATESFDRSVMDQDIFVSPADEKNMDKMQRYMDLLKLEQRLDERRKAARDALKEIDIRGAELDRRYEHFKHMEGRTLELRTKTEELNAREATLKRKQRFLGQPNDRMVILEDRVKTLAARKEGTNKLREEFVAARQYFEEQKQEFAADIRKQSEACEARENELRAEDASLRAAMADGTRQREGLVAEKRFMSNQMERQWAASRGREQQLIHEKEDIQKQHEEVQQRHNDWEVKESHRIEQVQKAERLKEEIFGKVQQMKKRADHLRKLEEGTSLELKGIQESIVTIQEERRRHEQRASALEEELLQAQSQHVAVERIAHTISERMDMLRKLDARAAAEADQLCQFESALKQRGEELTNRERVHRVHQRQLDAYEAQLRSVDRGLVNRQKALTRRQASLRKWETELRWRDAEVEADERQAEPGGADAQPLGSAPKGVTQTGVLKKAYMEDLQRRRVRATTKIRKEAADTIVLADCKRLLDDFTPAPESDSCFTVSAARPLIRGDGGKKKPSSGLLGECIPGVLLSAAESTLRQEVSKLNARFAEAITVLGQRGVWEDIPAEDASLLTHAEERGAELRAEAELLRGLLECPILSTSNFELSHQRVFLRKLRSWWEVFGGAVTLSCAELPTLRTQCLREALGLLQEHAPEAIQDGEGHAGPSASLRELRSQRLKQRIEDADTLLKERELLPVAASKGDEEDAGASSPSLLPISATSMSSRAKKKKARPQTGVSHAAGLLMPGASKKPQPRWRKAARMLSDSEALAPEVAAAETFSASQMEPSTPSDSDTDECNLSRSAASPISLASPIAIDMSAMISRSDIGGSKRLAPEVNSFQLISEDPDATALLTCAREGSRLFGMKRMPSRVDDDLKMGRQLSRLTSRRGFGRNAATRSRQPSLDGASPGNRTL